MNKPQMYITMLTIFDDALLLGALALGGGGSRPGFEESAVYSSLVFPDLCHSIGIWNPVAGAFARKRNC
jgi:hypothetical protein